jgi:glutamate-1-semialdehyde 2,1-aminomutase
LTTLGKVIGGGLPLAAYGGRRDLMRQIAPAGPVYQAGTLSGNPLAVAAGRAALSVLSGGGTGSPYEQLERTGARLEKGIAEAARRHGLPCRVERQGSMLGLFFTASPVRRLEDVDASDRELFKRVFHRLLAHGVHLPPSPYEALFLSTAHGEAEIDLTLEAFDRAFREAAEGGLDAGAARV